MYFTFQQKKLLKMWIGCSRFIFNWVISKYQQYGWLDTHIGYRRRLQLLMQDEYAFLQDLPYSVMDISVKEAVGNLKGYQELRRLYPTKKHGLPRRTKKNPQQTLPVRAQNIKKRNEDFIIFPRKLCSLDILRNRSISVKNDTQSKRRT